MLSRRPPAESPLSSSSASWISTGRLGVVTPQRHAFTLVEPLEIQVTLPQGHFNNVDVVVAQPKNVSMRIYEAGRERRTDAVKILCFKCRLLQQIVDRLQAPELSLTASKFTQTSSYMYSAAPTKAREHPASKKQSTNAHQKLPLVIRQRGLWRLHVSSPRTATLRLRAAVRWDII
jgi:hypothetical protein